METGKRYYDKQFKEEAIRLVLEGGWRLKDVAENLGINAQMLSKWKCQYERNGKEAFPGKGHLMKPDEELRQLRRQLNDVTMERDILKKAVAICDDCEATAIFSRRPK